MGSRTATCPTCGRSWGGRDVRYCGACGDHLDVTTPRRSEPRLRRALTAAVAGGALVATGVGLATVVTSDRPDLVAGDPDVELGSGATDPAGEPLSPEEAEALLQRVDPDRLRCEPRGCEVWRRDRANLSGVATLTDLVVLLEGTQMAALDAETGEELWTAPVGRLRGVTSDGDQLRSNSSQGHIAANRTDDGIFLVTGNEVSLIGLDSDRAWTVRPEPGIDWNVAVLDDLLVLHGPMRTSDNAHRIVALDPETGGTVWTARGTSVLVVDDEVVVITSPDRRLRGLDPTTGFTMWERTPQLGLWADRVGPWIALHRENGLTLLDATTGTSIGTVSGYPIHPPRQVGDLWLVVIVATTRGPVDDDDAPLALVAMTDDGDEVWRVPVGHDEATDCCALTVEDDGRYVRLETTTTIQRVDPDGGRIVGEWPRDAEGSGAAPDGEPGDGDGAVRVSNPVGSTFQAADGTTFRWTAADALIIDGAEGRASILGGEIWVETTEPIVVGSPDHLMGVRVLPD